MKPAQWIAPLDEKAQDRLRGMLAKLTGPAGKTVRWLTEDADRWGRLCWIAQHYSMAEPLGENWKDAEGQWRAVHDAAQALNTALENLGHLACAIRLDAGARSPGFWESVSGYLHPVPGAAFAAPVHDLEWFAKVAVEECERMKVQCNGARREDDRGELAFLIHQIFDLLEVPERPQAHAQRVAAVIHAWATGDKSGLGNPRFGERAIKGVRAFRKGTQTPA